MSYEFHHSSSQASHFIAGIANVAGIAVHRRHRISSQASHTSQVIAVHRISSHGIAFHRITSHGIAVIALRRFTSQTSHCVVEIIGCTAAFPSGARHSLCGSRYRAMKRLMPSSITSGVPSAAVGRATRRQSRYRHLQFGRRIDRTKSRPRDARDAETPGSSDRSPETDQVAEELFLNDL